MADGRASAGVQQGELLHLCAVCERRPPDGLAGDGRLMCEPCRRLKGVKAVRAVPRRAPDEAERR